MTVTEAVKLSGLTPSADYTGVETTDDFLLAVQTEASQTDVKNWVVCADHVREHSGALNASTTDNTYIRTGPVTTKGSVQRTLSIQGDRYVGDAFQDFLLSHRIAFGSGQSVVVPYLYFSLRTGKGEKGEGAHLDQRCGRQCRRKCDLCRRLQGHRHPGGVQLPYRRERDLPGRRCRRRLCHRRRVTGGQHEHLWSGI